MNTLIIALVGLLPGASLGEVGIVLAIAGLATTTGSLAPLYREQRRRVARQGGLAILFFVFGIARSWQLVGARNVSLASTVTAVIQRPAGPGRDEPGSADGGG